VAQPRWAFVPPAPAQPFAAPPSAAPADTPAAAPAAAPAAQSQTGTGASQATTPVQAGLMPTMCWVFGPAAGCARAEEGAP
jgi:hypothetical protein